ncbi:hypothetical protein [Psychrilyobacter atlanticus]|uniref:hypothetical protein n=1 Tax=Psychrilyobacter atlanticus TaxID=271091 RepID=UPI0003FF43CD|nr:hypothetical protein [Psychrilyobacter atlanticus]
MEIKESIKRLQIAKNLISEIKVLEVLKKYGVPLVIGSVAQEVVCDRDIDIVIETKNLRDTSKKILYEFIENENFKKIQYGDFVKFQRRNRPKGFIINIFVDDSEGNPWEFEIWILSDIKKYKVELEELSHRSREEKNNIIIKKFRNIII